MIKSKYKIIKGACKIKHRKIYLLINKDTLEILRMAWGESYDDAESYFIDWLFDNTKLLINDCFIVKVCKKSVN